MIWSNKGCNFRGITPWSNLNDLSLPMARSTWIISLAILRVLVTARLLSCFPSKKIGMFNVADLLAYISLIKKPRSAIMSSPCSILSRNPRSSTIRLSEILPVNNFWNIWEWSCWWNGNQCFECVVVLILWPCNSLRWWQAWFLHKKFSAVNNRSGFRKIFKCFGKVGDNLLFWRPRNKKIQFQI